MSRIAIIPRKVTDIFNSRKIEGQIYDETTGRYYTQEEWDQLQLEKERKKKLEPTVTDFPFPADTTEEPKGELTSGERTKVREQAIQDYPEGFYMDKYGKVTPNTPEEQAKRQYPPGEGRLTEEEKDKQILVERLKNKKIQETLTQAEEAFLSQEELREQVGTGAQPSQFEAIGAGALRAIPGLMAAGGAAVLSATGVGAVAGVPMATIAAGATGKAFIDGYQGYMGNVKAQTAGELTADKEVLKVAKTAFTSLITDQNQYPENEGENILAWARMENEINLAHTKLQQDTSENLNIWNSQDGTPELAKFVEFKEILLPVLRQRFNNARLNPDPEKAVFNQEQLDYINEFMEEE